MLITTYEKTLLRKWTSSLLCPGWIDIMVFQLEFSPTSALFMPVILEKKSRKTEGPNDVSKILLISFKTTHPLETEINFQVKSHNFQIKISTSFDNFSSIHSFYKSSYKISSNESSVEYVNPFFRSGNAFNSFSFLHIQFHQFFYPTWNSSRFRRIKVYSV